LEGRAMQGGSCEREKRVYPMQRNCPKPHGSSQRSFPMLRPMRADRNRGKFFASNRDEAGPPRANSLAPARRSLFGFPRKMARSLALSLRNVYETFAISFPTVVDASRRRVDMEECNRRLESWSARVVENLDIHLDVSGRENHDRSRTYVIM